MKKKAPIYGKKYGYRYHKLSPMGWVCCISWGYEKLMERHLLLFAIWRNSLIFSWETRRGTLQNQATVIYIAVENVIYIAVE